MEEELYYPCGENKGADQLRGYREADLRLCFRICKKAGFLTTKLICFNTLQFGSSFSAGPVTCYANGNVLVPTYEVIKHRIKHA